MPPLPDGSIVTLITPFLPSGGIDYDSIDRLIEWHFKCGTKGIFCPCLSSEMFDLTDDERLSIAKHVMEKVAGRMVVVSCGTYGGELQTQASFVTKMAVFCDAVVLNTSVLVGQDEDDNAWQKAAQTLLDLTGNVPLGTYECPVPYKRLLSPSLMKWCASTGRFFFHKDTSCSIANIKAKLTAVAELGEATPFRFYNANVETLRESIYLGGHGFSGISANFYPYVLARLCTWSLEAAAAHKTYPVLDHLSLAEPMDPAARLEAFVTLAEATVARKYPLSAKAYLGVLAARAGLPPLLTTLCRVKGPDGKPFTSDHLLEHEHNALHALLDNHRALIPELESDPDVRRHFFEI